ncbi:sulfur carrier protein ThiS [Halomonas sp. SSL-5]|uniref:sulfur carrier protein ThiS n=1 Tax=Halomonas sp. SSL-5 TaxID=3065855 RepID=UPI0027395ACF|nr:sulfur carrier protein ThiS [Halomonas sp. SSL-5]MDY7115117.1 sulfur carrier protein ThiS [Halomonas sp. SSL-5]
MNEITLSLNGEPARLPEGTALATALQRWGYGERRVAVAVNDAFAPRSTWPQRTLDDGDRIDIVAPVGGG